MSKTAAKIGKADQLAKGCLALGQEFGISNMDKSTPSFAPPHSAIACSPAKSRNWLIGCPCRSLP